jgi:hypothetical protein
VLRQKDKTVLLPGDATVPGPTEGSEEGPAPTIFEDLDDGSLGSKGRITIYCISGGRLRGCGGGRMQAFLAAAAAVAACSSGHMQLHGSRCVAGSLAGRACAHPACSHGRALPSMASHPARPPSPQPPLAYPGPNPQSPFTGKALRSSCRSATPPADRRGARCSGPGAPACQRLPASFAAGMRLIWVARPAGALQATPEVVPRQRNSLRFTLPVMRHWASAPCTCRYPDVLHVELPPEGLPGDKPKWSQDLFFFDVRGRTRQGRHNPLFTG